MNMSCTLIFHVRQVQLFLEEFELARQGSPRDVQVPLNFHDQIKQDRKLGLQSSRQLGLNIFRDVRSVRQECDPAQLLV